MGRFGPRGVSRFYWVPAVATATAPTRAEINAGTNLTGSIAVPNGVQGFALEAHLVEAAPVGARIVEQLPAAAKVTAPCSLLLYEDKTTSTILTAVAVGTSGFMILAPYGDVVGYRCEVWPLVVTTISRPWSDAVATFRAIFALRAAPTQNATLPA